jgi:hypothetical protein
MHLVKDNPFLNLVFTHKDPFKDGYQGELQKDVRLDYNMEQVHIWRDGEDAPEVCVGRRKSDPSSYKVFKYESELRANPDYDPVMGNPLVFGSWSDYSKLRLTPPDPVQTPPQSWYEYHDKLDEASREWRKLHKVPASPRDGSRDAVAEWLAERHLIADSGIREVFYLPSGASSNEIRLLEVNDQFAGDESRVKPIDFGLDVDGAPFQLLVADVTSDQLEQIRKDQSRLPAGWSLEQNRVWRRGA